MKLIQVKWYINEIYTFLFVIKKPYLHQEVSPSFSTALHYPDFWVKAY